jgi:hypothetical protein
MYSRVGIDAFGFGKKKTFAPAYNFCVYLLRNQVFLMGRELHFEVCPYTKLTVGGNKTDTNCKFTKNIMELFN